eukprot:TRINITY_DN1001_c0_g1_i1.p1 TRINITY_DN1001_c0_g1~~TRINITY_DN1001_c0_g1_i1.p1  ORF type:complete len:886 (+),score=185.37 TRINITY_DN1001_c0_g1_i1:99-2660(+)
MALRLRRGRCESRGEERQGQLQPRRFRRLLSAATAAGAAALSLTAPSAVGAVSASGALGDAADGSFVSCELERLQHEPFWDWTEPVERPGGLLPSPRRRRSRLLSSAVAALKDWPTLRPYLRPQAHVSYGSIRRGNSAPSELGVDARWVYPSWLAPEGPLHETMTLSDGLNAVMHAFHRGLRAQGGRERCSRSFDCAAALLVSEAVSLTRQLLATGATSASTGTTLNSLEAAWGATDAWPWQELIERGWGPSVFGSLAALGRALRDSGGGSASSSSSSSSAPIADCCEWDESLRLLLEVELERPARGVAAEPRRTVAASRLGDALRRAPSVQCCGGLATWLVEANAVLHLAGDVFRRSRLDEADDGAEKEEGAGNEEEEELMTHGLCSDEGVVRVPLRARRASAAGDTSELILHVHGANVFARCRRRSCQIRVEVLHFLTAGDGCARFTSYGKTARERAYYAHALTYPDGHLFRWRLSLRAEEEVPSSSTRSGSSDACRSVSYFGYDSVLYCSLSVPADMVEGTRPLVFSLQAEAAGEVFAAASAAASSRLCPLTAPLELPAKPRAPRIAACTQPLHGFNRLGARGQELLDEFLEYHLMLGVEHFTIFDSDGSFEEPLRERVRQGVVEYVPRWPERFAGTGSVEANVSGERPILLEVEAENFCVWRYRGRADWVAVLHSPDEFLFVPGDMESADPAASAAAASEGALRRFLSVLHGSSASARLPQVSHVEVRQALFGGNEEAATSESVTLPARFLHRAKDEELRATVPHTYIANVRHFAQGGVHPGRGRPEGTLGEQEPPVVVEADPVHELRINHYIDALGTKRCGPALCGTLDESAAELATRLERRLEARKR